MDEEASSASVASPRRVRPPIDQEFQRAYKACETCKKRKSRCILSAEDYAANKPCARCRRELKECVFSVGSHSRARKTARRAQTDSPAASMRRNEAIYRPSIGLDRQPSSSHDHQSSSGHNRHLATPPNRDALVRTVVSSGNDALNLLFEAAHHQTEGATDEDSIPRQRSPHVFQGNPGSVYTTQTPAVISQPAGPTGTASDVLQVWKSCRFVKMGWFSPGEAVYFIDT